MIGYIVGMVMQLCVRVFTEGMERTRDFIAVDSEALDTLIPDLAAKHAHMMANQVGMIEIEFLDEPNQNERYFRIGTSPSGMVVPLRVL